jgi:hypothetical protein
MNVIVLALVFALKSLNAVDVIGEWQHGHGT